MATLTATPAQVNKGGNVVVTGDGFAVGAEVTVSIPELGLSSEILSDAAGFFGTDDIADHAVTTITSSGVQVTANDTVTLGAVTYTFKNGGITTTANEVNMGADAAGSLANLKKAINLTGVAGTDYGSLTVIHPTVGAGDLTPTVLKVYAKTGGTGGNALASTKVAATYTIPGATFNSGTPGTAATGVRAMVFAPEREGVITIKATDGTNTAQTKVTVTSE